MLPFYVVIKMIEVCLLTHFKMYIAFVYMLLRHEIQYVSNALTVTVNTYSNGNCRYLYYEVYHCFTTYELIIILLPWQWLASWLKRTNSATNKLQMFFIVFVRIAMFKRKLQVKWGGMIYYNSCQAMYFTHKWAPYHEDICQMHNQCLFCCAVVSKLQCIHWTYRD